MDVKNIPFSYIEDFNRGGFIADLARWCAPCEEDGLYLDSDVFVVGDGTQHDLLSRNSVSISKEKIKEQAYRNSVICPPVSQDGTAK